MNFSKKCAEVEEEESLEIVQIETRALKLNKVTNKLYESLKKANRLIEFPTHYFGKLKGLMIVFMQVIL